MGQVPSMKFEALVVATLMSVFLKMGVGGRGEKNQKG
jgi:hypothetical protein